MARDSLASHSKRLVDIHLPWSLISPLVRSYRRTSIAYLNLLSTPRLIKCIADLLKYDPPARWTPSVSTSLLGHTASLSSPVSQFTCSPCHPAPPISSIIPPCRYLRIAIFTLMIILAGRCSCECSHSLLCHVGRRVLPSLWSEQSVSLVACWKDGLRSVCRTHSLVKRRNHTLIVQVEHRTMYSQQLRPG